MLSSGCPSSFPPTTLPAEIVLDCLEVLVEHVSEEEDFSQAYLSLSNCAEVSKLWRGPAQKVLISNVELVKKDQAISLMDTLRRTKKGESVRTLVAGIGNATEVGQHTLDATLLADLLSTCCNIRKLALLHHDLARLPECQFPPLPHLEDVTMAASGWKSSPRIEVDFLRNLPNIRFLHLPCPETTRILPDDLDCSTPPFKLFGYSVQNYPSPISDWALRNSSDTLQALTVAYMGDLVSCAKNHPGLRSLRILTRVSQISMDNASGLERFPNLERLEIRDLSVTPHFLRTLPRSVKYLRFWSSALAQELAQENGLPPGLKTVVWDWHCPTGGSDDRREATRLAELREALQRVCGRGGVDLRLYERKDGRRAAQGKDLDFEADFRASCYKTFSLHHRPDNSLPPTKLPVRVFRDIYTLGLPLAAHFNSISPFMDSTPGLWSPIFEDCLEGHGEWLSRHLPALKATATPPP